MGFASFNSLAGALASTPTSDTRNLLQSSTAAVRPLTIRAKSTLEKDLLRIEGSTGTPWLRFGTGPLNAKPVEEVGGAPSMSLFVRSGADGTGYVGSGTDDDVNRLYFTGGVNPSVGAGPHLFLDTGRGRPATEYWYTEILHKHNDKHVFTAGIETYDSTHKHYYEAVCPTDTPNPLTFIYSRTIDWQTGRQVFNPGATFPTLYGSTVEMRSEATTTPVLWLTAKASQTADLLTARNSDGTSAVRVGPGGLAGIAEGALTAGPNLVARSVSGGGGYVGAHSSNDVHEFYFTALAQTSGGAGPRSIRNVAMGRPASEYWYTLDGHQHNSVDVYSSGIESFSSVAKHFYRTVNLSGGSVRYVTTTDWATGRTIFNPYINGGTGSPATYTHVLDVRGEGAAVPVLRVVAGTSQTADLQTWTNVLTGVESRVNKSGYFMTRRVSAPADGDMVNSEVAFWLTDTPGSTQLRIKAKDSAGTVRNGTVTLT